MTSVADRVKALLEASLKPTYLDIIDLEQGSCHGAKLQVTIISDVAFEGKPLLQRHRLVNECLSELLADDTIHALTMKTYTTSQYEKIQDSEATK